MVKREEISTKMKSYSEEEGKLGALEALYMWSKDIGSKTIAGVLSNRYGSTEGFSIMRNDLSSLEIKATSDRTEETSEEIEVVIRDVFRDLQQALLDKTAGKLATLGTTEKNLLLTLIRSSLFEKEKIKLDELKIAYHALFGQIMKDRELINALLHLEKVGIFYCERPYLRSPIDTIIIPSYIYSIQPQIEAKLEKVHFTEGESQE